jgi:type I restriction enzyme S subunit
MSRLLEGWIETSFMEVFDIQGGTQPPKAQFKYEPQEGYIRLLQIRDFGDRPVPTYIPNKSGLKTCNKDDVLIGRYGASVGRICTNMEGAYNVALAKVITTTEIDKRFVFYLLQSDLFQKPILAIERSAQDGFNKDDLERICIPLIPLAEQRRIVSKLEPLLRSVDAYQRRLVKIPVILKRFRQAVLAAACDGRLTAKWREERAYVGPVFPLLQETDTDNQNGLPETWAIVSVGDTISGLKYGTSQKCGYEKVGTPVLRIPNIGEGVVDQSDLKYADLPANELEQLKLRPGDVLLIRSNGSVSLVGRAALVRESEEGLAYAGYLIRLRPDTSRILPPYLNLVLGIRDVRLQIEIPARSTSGVNNINSDEVKALKIPLPPLAEQAEIVRHVETLFKLADQIEARYQKAKAQVDELPQSILAKAFRGELVPTEAELARREGRDYEPASVLLERIRSERAEHAQGRKEKAGSRRKPTTKRDVDKLWRSSA